MTIPGPGGKVQILPDEVSLGIGQLHSGPIGQLTPVPNLLRQASQQTASIESHLSGLFASLLPLLPAIIQALEDNAGRIEAKLGDLNQAAAILSDVVAKVEAAEEKGEEGERQAWAMIARGMAMLPPILPGAPFNPMNFGGLGGDLASLGDDLKKALEKAEPALREVSAVAGWVSFGLAIVGIIGAPFGVGELADALNEVVVTPVKTAADVGLLIDGDQGARVDLAWDGVALASGGMGRVLEGGADAARLMTKGQAAIQEMEDLRRAAQEAADSGDIAKGVELFNKSRQCFDQAQQAANELLAKSGQYSNVPKVASAARRFLPDVKPLGEFLRDPASAVRPIEGGVQGMAERFISPGHYWTGVVHRASLVAGNWTDVYDAVQQRIPEIAGKLSEAASSLPPDPAPPHYNPSPY